MIKTMNSWTGTFVPFSPLHPLLRKKGFLLFLGVDKAAETEIASRDGKAKGVRFPITFRKKSRPSIHSRGTS